VRVDEATRKALKILDELVCERPPPPYVLDEEYLRLVARAEELPGNQDGADKSWVFRALQAHRERSRSIHPR